MRVYLLRRVFPLSKKYTLFPFLGQITQKKLRYRCLRVVDVTACSVVSDKPLACGKECLARL